MHDKSIILRNPNSGKVLSMAKFVFYFGIKSLDGEYSHEIVSEEKYDDIKKVKSDFNVLRMLYKTMVSFPRKERESHERNKT